MALIAAYSFDNSDATDESGRGHDGSLVNTPTFPTGKNGLGLGLASASTQYVTVPDHDEFNFTAAAGWTIMCWFKLSTLQLSSLVVKPNQWWFGYDSGLDKMAHGYYFSGGGSSGSALSAVLSLSTGTWVHAAARYNTSTTDIEIVINGAQSGTTVDASSNMANTTDLVRIGAWDGSEYTDGVIDDVRIFDEFLSDAQIASLMNVPVGSTGRIYKRLYGPAQLTGSAADLYTCPADTVARVLGIHASNPSGSPVDINLSIGADATGTRIFEDYAVPADGIVRESYPYELAAGEKLQGWADSAGTVVLTITGYEDPV